MHLRSSTKPWFLEWLAGEHPALIRRYRGLYGRGAYVTAEYSSWLRDRLQPLVARHGLAGRDHGRGEHDGSEERDLVGTPQLAEALTLF